MDVSGDIVVLPAEAEGVQRERHLSDDALSLDVVSAFAGDRPMSEPEEAFLDGLRTAHGSDFFSDLLFAITHEHFPSAVAENLWNEILRHKVELSGTVRRNVGVAVAALDYLSNLKHHLKSATLIGEAHAADITRMAMRDGLTRLFNHATCLEKISVELRIYHRYGRPASLILVDVDDFKWINDMWGHGSGDRVLAELGSIIDANARGPDICCRYGGEEFAVILPETRIADAGDVAERLRATVEKTPSFEQHVTLSIGISACDRDTHTAQDLVDKADVALYEAKRKGKNCVVISHATTVTSVGDG